MSDIIESKSGPDTPSRRHANIVASPPATIQVPAAQAAASPPANPFVNIDDLLALQLASDPQISPDGSLIAFTVHQCIGEANTTSSAIWLVQSKGGKTQIPRQVTGLGTGNHHESAPRWSPDGHFLAFLSDRRVSIQLSFLLLARG